MPIISEQHIARLESQLEHLVEGVFAQFFGKRINIQDVALQLARAMEDQAEIKPQDPTRPIAPDRYTIAMHGDVRQQLLQQHPDLPEQMSQYLVELAMASGYRMNQQPIIDLAIDEELAAGTVRVLAGHQSRKTSTTAVMKPVSWPPEPSKPLNPHLLLNGQQMIMLSQELVNIGRSRDNHIVIDDRAVSRYHAQLRLRFGRYLLFDTNSQTGTFVNDAVVKEHQLHPGDVIRLGSTRLIYMEDPSSTQPETSIYPPVLPAPSDLPD